MQDKEEEEKEWGCIIFSIVLEEKKYSLVMLYCKTIIIFLAQASHVHLYVC